MARQIIDLPRINLADLADDDVLIIRDSSAKKDMRITVGDLKKAFGGFSGLVGTDDIEDGAITSAKLANSAVSSGNLANNSVTSAKIANGTISKDDINWRSMPSRMFEIFSKASLSSSNVYSFTSPRGNVYTYQIVNGTGIQIVSGGSKILASEQIVGRKINGIDASVNCRSLAPGSALWCRVYSRASNGSWNSNTEGSHIVSNDSSGWATLATISGNKTAVGMKVTAIRAQGSTNTMWKFLGKVGFAGVLSTMSFEAEGVAKDANTVPCVYQGNLGSENQPGFVYARFLEGD